MKFPEKAIIWPADHNMPEDIESFAREHPITGKWMNDLLERIEALECKEKELQKTGTIEKDTLLTEKNNG